MIVTLQGPNDRLLKGTMIQHVQLALDVLSHALA